MAKVAVTTPEKAPGPIGRLINYLREVRVELEKVTWPTMPELKASTTIVLIFLVIMAVMTGVMDAIFQKVVLLLFSLV